MAPPSKSKQMERGKARHLLGVLGDTQFLPDQRVNPDFGTAAAKGRGAAYSAIYQASKKICQEVAPGCLCKSDISTNDYKLILQKMRELPDWPVWIKDVWAGKSDKKVYDEKMEALESILHGVLQGLRKDSKKLAAEDKEEEERVALNLPPTGTLIPPTVVYRSLS